MNQPVGIIEANPLEKMSDSLVAAFPLNSPSGITIQDAGLYSHDGTLNNLTDTDADAIWVHTDRGFALDFLDTTLNPPPRVLVDNSASHLTLEDAVTLSLWINPDRVSGGQGLVSRSTNYFVQLSDQKLEFGFQDNTSTTHTHRTTANVITSTGVWYHIVASFDFEDSTSMKLYVDGVEFASSWVAGTGIPAPNTNPNSFIINSTSISTEFDGRIQNVCVWRRALSSDEVASLFVNPWSIYKHFNITPLLVIAELIEVSGGVLAGGSAVVSLGDIVEVAGGAVAGGEAVITSFEARDALGGAVAGGEADPDFFDVVEVGGGALASGLAFVSLGEDVFGLGGALAGGSAVVTSFEARDALGGALAGGSADPNFLDIVDVSGGALAGGTADLTQVFFNAALGGVLAGGVADPDFIDVVEVGGGILAGGLADVVLVYVPPVGGGVLVGSGRYANGFKYRRLLTVPAGAVSSDFEKWYLSVSAGLDIGLVVPSGVFRFEGLTGERLYHYERLWDSVTGRFVSSVKTPLTTGSDTLIYLYFGT